MKKNKWASGIISVLLLLLVNGVTIAQINPLNRKISINLSEITVQDALIAIGQSGSFDFSYNAGIIDGDRIVSLEVNDNQVHKILSQLFSDEIRWKVVSNHIILMHAHKKNIRKSQGPSDYVISGYIFDLKSGKKLRQATVYEVDGKIASISNMEGFYHMKIPAGKDMCGLNYCKNGYYDTVIIIQPDQRKRIDIYMNPKYSHITKVETIVPDLEKEISDRNIVHLLVPREAIINSQNLVLPEKRFLQVSFLPFVGSNRMISGSVTNKFSFNVLAGYSNGVEGTEIGGLFNIVGKDVTGIQFAGLGNIVGRNTVGMQLSGFFNVNAGTFKGIQYSGFSNVVWDTLSGVQISGFHNMLKGEMHGVQISGFNNVTTQYVDGLQLTGFANVAFKDVRFAQLAGFFNYARNVGGGQFSGFVNVASGDVNAAQISGFVNYARSVSGVQISGFANVIKEENSGAQISGFFNRAKIINGLQLGFINVCDSVKSGVPIGFLSFVNKGYHRFEVSANDLFLANLSFKTGIHSFYNIFQTGYSNQNLYYGAYGIGSRINFNKWISTSLDFTSAVLFDSNGKLKFEGNIGKLSATFDFRLAKHFTLFLGPSISLLAYETENEFAQNLKGFHTIYEESFEDVSLRSWIGGSVGIRL
ncbi:MAG: hypothetical protein JEZ03_07005 [Bacteroidales bacterium]|nr:hypothetical protein [Bacteroidales bacterium]